MFRRTEQKGMTAFPATAEPRFTYFQNSSNMEPFVGQVAGVVQGIRLAGQPVERHSPDGGTRNGSQSRHQRFRSDGQIGATRRLGLPGHRVRAYQRSRRPGGVRRASARIRLGAWPLAARSGDERRAPAGRREGDRLQFLQGCVPEHMARCRSGHRSRSQRQVEDRRGTVALPGGWGEEGDRRRTGQGRRHVEHRHGSERPPLRCCPA